MPNQEVVGPHWENSNHKLKLCRMTFVCLNRYVGNMLVTSRVMYLALSSDLLVG